MKTCSHCKERKEDASFYVNRRIGGLQTICKQCCKITAAERYKINKGRILKKNKEWRENNLDKAKEISHRGMQGRRERYRAENKRWRENNKEYDAFRSALRRANRKQATPAWINPFIIEEAYHLAKLRTKATGIIWHVDHIVPLQSDIVCGLHCEYNLQLTTDLENYAKGNRWWPDMPPKLGLDDILNGA